MAIIENKREKIVWDLCRAVSSLESAVREATKEGRTISEREAAEIAKAISLLERSIGLVRGKDPAAALYPPASSGELEEPPK